MVWRDDRPLTRVRIATNDAVAAVRSTNTRGPAILATSHDIRHRLHEQLAKIPAQQKLGKTQL